jgi:hypothetical protein
MATSVKHHELRDAPAVKGLPAPDQVLTLPWSGELVSTRKWN